MSPSQATDSSDPSGPNADQIRFWNESAAQRWVALHEPLAAQLQPFGRKAMDRASIAPGERVLDVGCGCGETTLEIARRAGPSGEVTGVDVSAIMLERARAYARDAGVSNATFLLADAQTHPLPEAAFDLLFSRFGVMFFNDPEAAFENLRRSLRKGGRLAFVCWRTLSDNPWMAVPLAAVVKHVAPPEAPPHAPGPLAFADADRVRGILTRAGFTGVRFEPVDVPLQTRTGRTLDEVVSFALQMGPAGAAARTAGPELWPTLTASLREALAPYFDEDGLRLGAGAWLVTGEAASTSVAP